MRIRLLLTALLAAGSLPATATAQGIDPNLARNLAATCANCHNATGSSITDIPSIAGQPREVLAKALREFKEGKRPATVMHQLAKGYTDAQLDLLAAHFAAQK